MNTQRRKDQGLGATANGGSGGSFASHERAGSAPPAAAGYPTHLTITIPAREVNLVQPNKAPTWPESVGAPTVSFGEDDSGRFFSAYQFTTLDGEELDLICTDYEDGAEFSGTYSEDAGFGEDWDHVEHSVLDIHANLRTNSYRVGQAACDSDPELAATVAAVSQGVKPPIGKSQDYSFTDKERGAYRGEIFARSMTGSTRDSEDRMTDIQDGITDLMHHMESNGLSRAEVLEHVLRATKHYEHESQNSW